MKNVKLNGRKFVRLDNWEFYAVRYIFEAADVLLLLAYVFRKPFSCLALGTIFRYSEILVAPDYTEDFEEICTELGITWMTEKQLSKFHESKNT